MALTFTLHGRGTGLCPATGRHVKYVEGFVTGDSSYNSGGEDLEPILDTLDAAEFTSVVFGEAAAIDVSQYLTIEGAPGTYTLAWYTTTSDTDDTPVEIPAATNLALSSLKVRFYGV